MPPDWLAVAVCQGLSQLGLKASGWTPDPKPAGSLSSLRPEDRGTCWWEAVLDPGQGQEAVGGRGQRWVGGTGGWQVGGARRLQKAGGRLGDGVGGGSKPA